MTVELPAITAAAGVLVGVFSGLVAARYTWRKDRRESDEAKLKTAQARSVDDREREEAADRATDRLVEALRDANSVTIENERLKYENMLYVELNKLKAQHKKQLDEMRASLVAEMERRISEALDVYGCENAAAGCTNRKPRTYAAVVDVNPGGTD